MICEIITKEHTRKKNKLVDAYFHFHYFILCGCFAIFTAQLKLCQASTLHMLINLSAQRLMSNDLMTSYCCHKSIMAWKVLIRLFLLATIVCLCAGKLMLKPRDTDAKINHSAYFNCSTDLSSDIFWFHGSNYIYAGGVILEPYNERFTTEKYKLTSNGTFSNNLVIQSVQPGDAGKYICADDEGIGERKSVQLVVLDGDPICRSSIELNKVIGQNTCNVEPDEVELSCSGAYHGNIHPHLQWKKDDDKSISEVSSNVTYSNHYSYLLKLKGDISLDKSYYFCQATRFVHEPRKCFSEVINVLYALSDNSTVNRNLGDEILCHANTTQSCNYTWRWFKNNDVTTESSSATLKPRKTGLHKCEAECYLRNKACNLVVMHAMVHDNAESTQAKNASISVVVVVVSVVATLVLIAVLLFVFNNRKRKKKENRLQLALLPKQHIGSASAWSYFYGYLRIVLPDFKTRLGLIEGTLNNDPAILPKKTVQRMLIIMPDSCICAESLVVPTKIESTDVVLVANRDGNQQRKYKNSLYKLIDHERKEEYYFVGEFASPLLTMYETCMSALCGMTKDQLYVERDAFDSTLRAILSQRDNTKCNDQFKLLNWSDPATKKPNQLDIYNFLLPELRKEIELQQKVTVENVSLTIDDDKSVLLKEHPDSEPNVQLGPLPKEAIGRSSALGYFFDYLGLVLPDFEKRLIRKTLKNDPDIVPKTVKKMLIIIPESCVCVKSLEVQDKIEFTGKSVDLVANRAGNQQREYKNSLYKLIDHEQKDQYYFVGEQPSSLLTMYEICISALMTKEQLYDERDAFYSTLEAILNHPKNAKCKNQFKLLKWSDPEARQPNQTDIYNFLLLELREQIKSHQQNKKSHSNMVKYNNVTRSLNTLEPLSTA